MRHRVLLAETVQSQLVERATAAGDVETGGILLGVTTARTPWVTAMAELPSARPAAEHYVLPEGETSRAVTAARRLDSRVGYVGEWHSHLSPTPPSLIDRKMMRTLFWYLDTPFPGPVMFIVQRHGHRASVDGYLMRIMTLRRATIVATGDLPEAPSLPQEGPIDY